MCQSGWLHGSGMWQLWNLGSLCQVWARIWNSHGLLGLVREALWGPQASQGSWAWPGQAHGQWGEGRVRPGQLTGSQVRRVGRCFLPHSGEKDWSAQGKVAEVSACCRALQKNAAGIWVQGRGSSGSNPESDPEEPQLLGTQTPGQGPGAVRPQQVSLDPGPQSTRDSSPQGHTACRSREQGLQACYRPGQPWPIPSNRGTSLSSPRPDTQLATG